MQIFKKFFVFTLGIIFVFSVFEVFLRVFYSNAKPQFYSEVKGKDLNHKKFFNILVLGNSHTVGAGVAKESAYSGVLQSFFDIKLKDTPYKVNVFNAGMANANTSDIYDNLERFIAESKPHLALIMAGEPNIWNRNGYSKYAQMKEQAEESQWLRLFIQLSEYSKSIRWLINLKSLTSTTQLSPEQENELIVLKEMDFLEKNILYIPEKNDPTLERRRKALTEYIEKNKNLSQKPENWRMILYAKARLEFFGFDQFDVGFQYFNESINYDLNNFDMPTYINLKDIIFKNPSSSSVQATALQMMAQMEKQPQFPGFENLEAIENFSMRGQMSVLDTHGSLDFLELNHKLFPTFASPAIELSSYYVRNHSDPVKATQVLIETLTKNPFSSRTNIGKIIVETASDKNSESVSRGLARQFIQNFTEKFPTEKYFFTSTEQDTLYNWLIWSMEQIIDMFQKHKVRLVIQNYHWIRDRAEAGVLYKANFDVAQKREISFIDTHQEFQSTVLSQPENVESYFVQKFGRNDSHPSEKGHKLIAYIIYKNLVQQKLLPDELSHFDANEILK